MIDTATNTTGPAVSLPAGSGPRGIAITPDGSSAYVVDSGADNVTPIATAGNTVGSAIPVGGFPQSVAIVPDQGPVAAFGSTPVPAGQPTGFDGSASSDPDGTVARYDWDFGDGATLPNGGPTPTHTYATAGTYVVSLTVTDNENCSTNRVFTGQTVSCNGSSTAQRSQQLSISPQPPPQIPVEEPQSPQEPKCKHLGKKLKRQQAKLVKATSESKRSMVGANIEDTKRRLQKLGCKQQF